MNTRSNENLSPLWAKAIDGGIHTASMANRCSSPVAEHPGKGNWQPIQVQADY
jgi:hypothetical protein